MASKRTAGSRPRTILCTHCGKQYSSAYRRCPFCDNPYNPESGKTYSGAAGAAGGGRRLEERRRTQHKQTSPLKIIAILLSMAIIFAAVLIVIKHVIPIFRSGSDAAADPGVSVSDTAEPTDAAPSLTESAPSASDSEPSAAVTDSSTSDSNVLPSDPEVSTSSPAVSAVAPVVSESAAPSPSPEVSITPAPSATPSVAPEESTEPVANEATGFQFNRTDVTLSSYGATWTPTVTFSPSGSSGTLTWESADSNIAIVSQSGVITAINRGNTTITATLPDGTSHSITVRCSVYSSLNKSDFTFFSPGEDYQLRVNGYSGTVTWTSSNPAIATVSSDGLVVAVGDGRCTITGTLSNGNTVTAVVRCNF